MENKNIISVLERYNIKPSVQRIAIMGYLLDHRTHPTVDEIFMALCDEIPTLSKTTVYHTLKLLVDNGAALMLTIDEHKTCFDADVSLHGHFLCKKCGKVFDFRYHPEHIEMDRELTGFKIEDVHQYYKGICKDCNNKAN